MKIDFKMKSCLVALTTCVLAASAAHADDDALIDLSLEELLTLEVTSVAKKPQKPEEAAAAISVITAEDIRSAGVTTLPEALRMAPGVEVAEIDGNITAVTIRGFNWRFSSKLLVLVDGRAIYSPSLSGLFWDQQLVPVEDIQRIELVRGPGAAMWGANAMNGVINIVTKHAADTLGGAATVEASTHDAKRVFARHGSRIGDFGAVRAYAHARDIPALTDADGENSNDGQQAWQAGFRMDLEPTAKDSFTFQGDIQKLEFETTTETGLASSFLVNGTVQTEASGYNLLGRWVRKFSDDNEITLQAYFDHIERTEFFSTFVVDVVDVDFSHRFRPHERLDFVWGANVRQSSDSVVTDQPPEQLSFLLSEYTYEWYSGFIQGEYQLVPDKLHVILGTKLEENSYTGFETQPSLRAIWLGDDDWSLWGAASRAVRTPSRIETSLNARVASLPASPPPDYQPSVSAYLRGNEDFDIESMVAYEVGFRKTFHNGAELDLAAYHQDYDDLLTIVPIDPQFTYGQPFGPMGPTLPVHVTQIVTMTNGGSGSIKGLEASLKTRVTDFWDVTANLDVRDPDINAASVGQGDIKAVEFAGDSPNWQASIRSDLTLGDSMDATVNLRHVSEMDRGQGDAYTDLDIRLGWQINDNVELSVIGENLLEDRRLEVKSGLYPAPDGYIERRAIVRVGVRF